MDCREDNAPDTNIVCNNVLWASIFDLILMFGCHEGSYYNLKILEMVWKIYCSNVMK